MSQVAGGGRAKGGPRRETAAKSSVASDLLQLTGVSLSAYEEIVRSDQVITIRAYFVKRWLRLLGAEAAWLVVAFRQVAFLCRALEHGAWFEASGAQLAQMAGLNRATFWKHLGQNQFLQWFITRDTGSPRWLLGEDGRPHRAVNRYRVQRNVPLVPADQAHVRRWLAAHAPSPDAAGMIAAIRQALQAPPDRLLAGAAAAPAPGESGPLSLQEIARQALPEARYAGETLEVFSSLCDDLYAHLVPPKDIVVITHYFMREWLPRLGHGPAWIICHLRDQCYFDPASGVARDTIWVDGGLRALADLAGIAQSKTAGKWLRRKSRSRSDRWSASQFVAVLDRRKGHDKSDPQRVDLKAQLALREPLTSKDIARYQALIEQEAAGGARRPEGQGEIQTHKAGGSRREGDSWAAGRGDPPTHEPELEADGRLIGDEGGGEEQTHGRTAGAKSRLIGRGGQGARTTLAAAVRSKGRRIAARGKGDPSPNRRKGRGEKATDQGRGSGREPDRSSSLNKSKAPERTLQQPQQLPIDLGDESRSGRQVVVVGDERWDLESLMRAGRLPDNTCSRLRSAHPSPAAYASWYLFGLAQSSIQWPALHAAAKLLAHPDSRGAGEPYDGLAAAGPRSLAKYLVWALDQDRDPYAASQDGLHHVAALWQEAFDAARPAGAARIARQALRELGLSVEAAGAARPASGGDPLATPAADRRAARAPGRGRSGRNLDELIDL